MFHQGINKGWVLLFLPLILSVGCQSQVRPEQLSTMLLRKMDKVDSYQLSCTLESSGQTLAVKQWYKSPGQLRTDVQEQGQEAYRFVYENGLLHVMHLQMMQQQSVSLTAGNELVVTPILLDCCRQASQSTWQQDGNSGLYVSSFAWAAADNLQRPGRVWVDPELLLPTLFELTWPDQEVVRIRLHEVILNPCLDETLFSVTTK